MSKNLNKKSKLGRIRDASSKIDVILPPMGKYSSRQDWEDACWQDILKSKNAFEFLITGHERHDLVMRVAALERLESGKSYRQISNELWLSPQTISGIKKAFRENGYRSYLERSKTERKKKVLSPPLYSRPSKPRGKPKRTKYGTVYMPY